LFSKKTFSPQRTTEEHREPQRQIEKISMDLCVTSVALCGQKSIKQFFELVVVIA
jgi:hypothetical protein